MLGHEDDRAPEEPPLRAVIAFRWSPEFTVFSLRGGPPDSFDGIVDEVRRFIAANPAPAGAYSETRSGASRPVLSIKHKVKDYRRR